MKIYVNQRWYWSIGKFHIRIDHHDWLGNFKPAFQIGWDCRFWHTGWCLQLRPNGYHWTWNEDYDYV